MLGGAVQFWPLLEYTPWSPRAGGKGWDHAVSYSMPPEELFNGYLPQFSGMLMNYSGANGIHLHSEYFGVVVLMCAGLAFGAAVVSRRMQWFWAGALLLSVLWALGGNTPFYKLVYALVPGTSFFRAPSTMLYIVSFCLSVLAAIGADRVLSGRVARSRLLVYLAVWGVFAGVVALLGATGGLTTLARGFAIPGREARVEENAAALALGAWRSLAVVAVTALLLLGVTTGRITRQVGAWALDALALLLLVLLFRGRGGGWFGEGVAAGLLAWIFRGPLTLLSVVALAHLPGEPWSQQARVGLVVYPLLGLLAARLLPRPER